ncbi:MAG: ankyrin repeat domain-containing protein [Steroidobacteraceae bacterium]
MSESSRIESLRKQAKQWLKSLRAADAQAIARLRAALPNHPNDAPPTLRAVQLALARERGFDGWSALLAAPTDNPALRELADEMLRHAIFRGEHDIAARLFTQHPELARVDLYTVIAAGDLEEVERRLAADPAAATRAGGPHQWPPILYLAFMRLPGGATHAVEIARRLLDLGADPNSSWKDDWGNRFTVITGVIGLGEGVKPPHEQADELVALLVERGADPVDTQSFYDISIVDDDTHWLDVLWQHALVRGVTEYWQGIADKSIGGPLAANPLDFMLSLAVSYRHPRRAQWLLTHGANPNSRHAYSQRTQREEALVYGADEVLALLEQHGATRAPLDGPVGFIVACRQGDLEEMRRLALLHPEVLLDSEPMHTAAREGRFATVKQLLDLGMDVDIADHAGVRALNTAASNNRLDVMQLLIDRGADIDRPTQYYDGSMGFASEFGHRQAAALLAPYSSDVHNMVFSELKDRLTELFAADPELVNSKHHRFGVTPLYCLPRDEIAALEMARFLLQHGADKNFRNKEGETAAEAWRKYGFNAVAELLS